MTLLSQTIASIGTLLLAAPVEALGLLSWLGNEWAAWPALALGVALGVAYGWLGLRLGAKAYERQAPELLLTLMGD
jgi:ABC-2 type transport system permease protein